MAAESPIKSNSLFQGTPNVAATSSISSSETPAWLQNAIYSQVQLANTIASTPYEAYKLPTVAELSPLQIQSNAQVAAAQGSWKPAYDVVSDEHFTNAR